MQTLLVWFLVPEDIELYLIPEVGEWIEDCEGHYINGGAEGRVLAALTRVSDALSKQLEYCLNPDDELATQWVQYRLPAGESPVITGETRVVTCGFLL